MCIRTGILFVNLFYMLCSFVFFIFLFVVSYYPFVLSLLPLSPRRSMLFLFPQFIFFLYFCFPTSFLLSCSFTPSFVFFFLSLPPSPPPFLLVSLPFPSLLSLALLIFYRLSLPPSSILVLLPFFPILFTT